MFLESKLVGSTAEFPEAATALGATTAKMAKSMVHAGQKFYVGDVLLAEDQALQIKGCVETDAIPSMMLLVRVFSLVRAHGCGHLWQAVKMMFVSPGESFDRPSYWTFEADGKLLTLSAEI